MEGRVKAVHLDAYREMVGGLRELRRISGLRQADVARSLGRSRSWVQKIEACEVRLDVVQFVRLCRFYGATPAELIGRLDEELSDEDTPLFYLLEIIQTDREAPSPNTSTGDSIPPCLQPLDVSVYLRQRQPG